jgi:DNA polymerase (family X)
MENKEIARIFRFISQLMELHDENPFKAKSYASAAFRIERLEKRVADLAAEEMEKLEGVGKSIAQRIGEILQKGTTEDLEKMVSITPDGIIRMLTLKGIGPKKVGMLWRQLGIESLGELLYACNENRLVELKGFGLKTQDQIRQSIEFSLSNSGKYHYAALEGRALSLMNVLRELPSIKNISVTGALRRKCEVLEKIEFAIEGGESMSLYGLLGQNPFLVPDMCSPDLLRFHTTDGIPVHFHPAPEGGFAKTLFTSTGSADHIEQLEIKLPPHPDSEEAIYAFNNLQYVEPELREGLFETVPAKSKSLPELLKYEDLKGVIHNHSTYSDGIHSLEQMAMYCIEKGFEYFCICDHSQSAYYAGGLKPDEIVKQHLEIDELNKRLAPFKIFKGIESDILGDGSLDYPEEILGTFDLVVASIHSNLKMNEEKAMSRLIRAIENPFTTVLGHATGRLLLSRNGYPIDHRKIIDACALNHVAIEINSNPYRLDMDWRWIPYALEKGVMISVNPDAHKRETIQDMYFGVCVARKGLLTRERTLNALSLPDFENYLRNSKRMKNIKVNNV